jgi:hypothetical protein
LLLITVKKLVNLITEIRNLDFSRLTKVEKNGKADNTSEEKLKELVNDSNNLRNMQISPPKVQASNVDPDSILNKEGKRRKIYALNFHFLLSFPRRQESAFCMDPSFHGDDRVRSVDDDVSFAVVMREKNSHNDLVK